MFVIEGITVIERVNNGDTIAIANIVPTNQFAKEIGDLFKKYFPNSSRVSWKLEFINYINVNEGEIK